MRVLQLSIRALERGSLRDIASFKTELEPLHALLGRTMIERLWDGIAARLLLQVVVAYHFGTVDGLLDIAVL